MQVGKCELTHSPKVVSLVISFLHAVYELCVVSENSDRGRPSSVVQALDSDPRGLRLVLPHIAHVPRGSGFSELPREEAVIFLPREWSGSRIKCESECTEHSTGPGRWKCPEELVLSLNPAFSQVSVL